MTTRDFDRMVLEWKRSAKALAEAIFKNSAEHGFWPDGDRNDGEAIALMHSELSEALEALRSGNPPSVKAREFSQVEEELADCIVRILDYSAGRGLDVPAALVAKMKYNMGRPHKHGREF